MKKITQIFTVVTFLFVYSLQAQDSSAIEKRLKQLEQKVEQLEKEQQSLTEKTKLSFRSISGKKAFVSPLAQFFLADEFWKNTVDVGLSECSNGCAKRYAQSIKDCKGTTSQIAACKRRKRKIRDACQRDCAKHFPINLN